MIVDRRTFMAGAAFAAVAPVIPLLPPVFAEPGVSVIEPLVLKIIGWSAADSLVSEHELWVSVGFAWKTAWR